MLVMGIFMSVGQENSIPWIVQMQAFYFWSFSFHVRYKQWTPLLWEGVLQGCKHFSKEHLLIFHAFGNKSWEPETAKNWGQKPLKASLLSIHKIRCRTVGIMDGMTIFKKDEGQNEATCMIKAEVWISRSVLELNEFCEKIRSIM